jgi:hypothetical protein
MNNKFCIILTSDTPSGVYMYTYSSSVAYMFSYVEKKLLDWSQNNSLVFLYFFGNENVWHMFCRNKKLGSVKSRFLDVYICRIYKFWTTLASLYNLFLGRFQWNFQVILSCPFTNVPSFVEKYPKIKYSFLTGSIIWKWTFVKHLLNYWMDRIGLKP